MGLDPSLNNWGMAAGDFCLQTQSLNLQSLGVINPVLPKGKQVRQNSKDLAAALQLSEGVLGFINEPQAVFVEVPVGSQSARAMASYGICVGILGSLRAQGIPFFEITPLEVKLISVGNKQATKQQMIEWAMGLYPEAPWPIYTRKGVTQVSETKAEHIADAVAAIHAGVNLDSFKQLVQMIN